MLAGLLSPASAHAIRPRRAAFTLIEVILATGLATLLLAALWSALSLHLRAFDSGRTQVEEAQLARALLREIAHDLESIAFAAPTETLGVVPLAPTSPDPPRLVDSPSSRGRTARSSSGGLASMSLAVVSGASGASAATSLSESSGSAASSSSTVAGTGLPVGGTVISDASADSPSVESTYSTRRPGLSGTSTELLIDVLRPLPVDRTFPVEPRPPLSAGDDAIEPVPDLRTVNYHLMQADSLLERSQVDPSGLSVGGGLVRHEQPWLRAASGAESEPWSRHVESTRAGARWPSSSAPGPGTAIDEFGAQADPDPDMQGPGVNDAMGSEPAPRDDVLFAPEVAALGFRYFDGQAWHEAWDSGAAGRLPLAVEIVLVIRPFDQSPSRRDRSDVEDDILLRDQAALMETWPRYRLLVRLPAAASPGASDASDENGAGAAGSASSTSAAGGTSILPLPPAAGTPGVSP